MAMPNWKIMPRNQNNKWIKLDLEDASVEGFEDGCAYEIEELKDYKMVDGTLQIKEESEVEEVIIEEPEQCCPEPPLKAKKSKKKKSKNSESVPDLETAGNGVIDTGKMQSELIDWLEYALHPVLLQSLYRCGFTKPTVIQKMAMKPAIEQNQDIIGAAPTGSGKTLAFGLPILHQLLSMQESQQKLACRALILTPTRELAMQIQKHLQALLPDKQINIAVLVGGMAIQKQERCLSYAPQIVIATPGRLHELIQKKNPHLLNMHTCLDFLVIDEADRMLEAGSFRELGFILKYVNTERKSKRQSFLFSATLMMDSKSERNGNKTNTLKKLIQRVGFRGSPVILDTKTKSNSLAKPLTPGKVALPDGLEICQHHVTEKDKDVYLYCFLAQYPGRTIIFLNAIHQVRRLQSELALLKLPVFGLHAEMQQRQRLKKFDQYKLHAQGILVATDVAARGLDIPNVNYVIHYHIPRTPEIFIHRSGRTARADKSGLCLSLIAPSDARNHGHICSILNRPTGFMDFPFNHRLLPLVRERMQLAKAIYEQESNQSKVNSEAAWYAQMAAEADMELDECLYPSKSTQSEQEHKLRISKYRLELKQLLSEPMRPIGSTRKFINALSEAETDACAVLTKKSKKLYKSFCT